MRHKHALPLCVAIFHLACVEQRRHCGPTGKLVHTPRTRDFAAQGLEMARKIAWSRTSECDNKGGLRAADDGYAHTDEIGTPDATRAA